MSFFSTWGFVGVTLAVAAAWAVLLGKASEALANRTTWRRTVALAGLIGIGSLVAINEIDALLQAMHPPGRAGDGFAGLFGFSDGPYRSVDAWLRWYVVPEIETAIPLLHPRTVLLWHVFTDSVLLVPAYALFLGVLTRRTRAALGQSRWKEEMTRIGIPEEVFTSAQRATQIAIGLIAAVPFLDMIENGLALKFASERMDVVSTSAHAVCLANGACPTDAPARWLEWATSLATVLKWVGLGAAVALIVPSVLFWIRLHTDRARKIARTARRVRAFVVVQLAFVLLMLFNPQTEDILRSREAVELALELGFLIVLVLVTWWLARRVTHTSRLTTGTPWRSMTIAAIVLLVAGVSGIGAWPGPRGLLAAAVLLGVMALVEKLSPATERAQQEDLEGREVVPVVMSVAYIVIAGILESRAILGLTLFDRQSGFLLIVWTLVITVLLPSFISVWAYRWMLVKAEEDPFWLPTSLRGFPTTAKWFLAAGALLWLAVIIDPWATAELTGAVALVLLFFTLLTAFVGVLSRYVERRPPPAVFAAFGIHRTPVFALLAVWVLIPIVFGLAGKVDYHAVRFLPVSPEAEAFLERDAGADLTSAWERWITNQPELQEGSSGPRRTVPLVLVSAEGGGIKAAVWTALVLDCALSAEPAGHRCPPHDASEIRRVFAASGISGGSLGLATYATKESASQPVTGEDWVKDMLDHDHVSPSLAWQLFVEAPRAALQFDIPMDRAEVLERAWERPWPNGELGGGFVDLYIRDPAVPLLLLNGYSVGDGCKFVATPLDGNGGELASGNCTHIRPPLPLSAEAERAERAEAFLAGSRVLPDLLCEDGSDVRISTAALLSARFPYVSPSALLHGCAEPERRIQIADGGYLEGTGTGTLLDLWTALRPVVDSYNASPDASACIVPVLLQIGTGYGPSPDEPDARIDEGLVPLRGILNVPAGVGLWQVNQAEQAMLQELPGTGGQRGVYLRVAPVAHPGVQAPLGWTLSDTSYGDLARQLTAATNEAALSEFKTALDGRSCGSD